MKDVPALGRFCGRNHVFDDQIRTGIGITLAVRRQGASPRVRYYVAPPYERAAAKRKMLADLGASRNRYLRRHPRWAQ